MTDPAAETFGASPGDRILTIAFMVGAGCLAFVGGFMGFVGTIENDDCYGVVPCFDGPTNTGFLLSVMAPFVFGLAALVVVIVRWANARSTWWVPLAATVLGGLVWVLGMQAVLADASPY